MIPLRTRPNLILTVAGFVFLLAMACSDSPAPSATPSAAPAKPAAKGQQEQIQERLDALQAQAAKLDRQLTAMRAEEAQRLQSLTDESQLLSSQITALRNTLEAGKPAPALTRAAATPTAAGKAPAKQAAAHVHGRHQKGNPFVRVICLLIFIVAIVFIVKIFLGRWSEDEEDEDEFSSMAEEEAPGEKEAPPAASESSDMPADSPPKTEKPHDHDPEIEFKS